MNKLNVCVVFGGVSSEHSISCMSVKTVLDNIDREKYNVHTIGITRNGDWLYYTGSTDTLDADEWEKHTSGKAMLSPNRSDKAIIVVNGEEEFKKIHIDVMYPVLHGKNGEDGTIQGYFEIAGIPYVGAGVIGSAVCMDKCVAKILFEKAGIPQADWVEYKLGDTLDVKLIEEKLGYPCFIKPSSAGSSVGVTKANNESELKKGVEIALKEDYKVLIERAVNAREVECSVMGNLEPVTSDILGEIKPAKEFYDFEAKYEDENSSLMMPAPVSDEICERIKEYAKRAYRICECRGLSRVDFFVDRDTNEIYLNEINTLPGFTPISMYPKLWEKSGIKCCDLIDKHIEFALSREDLKFD